MAESLSDIVIPSHIGFIMDGNRRWGRKSGKKTPISGTATGVETLYKVVEACVAKGIKHMTVYAFSTENWRRNKDEVNYLMLLFKKAVPRFADVAKKNGVALRFVGRINDFPEDVQETIRRAVAETADGTSLVLNIAASYGGRAEVIDVTKQIIESGIKPDEVTEEKFREYIYEPGQPDLDLIVRTGGCPRTSGFMMWQSTYAELYFTDVLWPDFDEKELEKALEYYKSLQRNFGK